MKQIFFSIAVVLLFSGLVFAQPRPIGTSSTSGKPANVAPAPASFDANYEGGMFGFSRKQPGTVKFDDDNFRLIFVGKDQKEFQIPYKSVVLIYPETKSVTSTAGNVVSVAGGGPLGKLMKEKRQYLIVHFADPDIESAKGIVNFKLADKELLESVVVGLADKAELTQRGETYYRPKKAPKP